MTKVIIHTCSSILIRPNGIVRYINAVIDLQRKLGHYVVFVSDSKPSQVINAHQVMYDSTMSYYRPNMQDGHDWLQYDSGIKAQIRSALDCYGSADLIIAHDLHSFEAAREFAEDGIFVQHETDILTAGARFSYMDDEYIAHQFSAVNSETKWRIGMTVDSKNINPVSPVSAPCPIQLQGQVLPAERKTKDLLYIGDASERKGAREFMDMARRLGVTPTVITHERDQELFEGANIHSFDLTESIDMYRLMSRHKVAYIPSKNECPGLAIIECLQFMPVVVDGQYPWTQYIAAAGADVKTGADIESTIRYYLSNPGAYTRDQVERWTESAHEQWTAISNA